MYAGITARSGILHVDSCGLGSSFSYLFKLYFFLNSHNLIFYLLEIVLSLFSFYFSFYGVKIFSFDLLKIDI
jgi:hypothetical protein